MYFGGELPELEFEQGGRRYWVMAGLPGGLGFDVYPPGQKLTIYLQRVGFASGYAGGGADHGETAGRRHLDHRAHGPRDAQRAHGRGRAPPGSAPTGPAPPPSPMPGASIRCRSIVAGRHSIAPGLYSYENGVRTALLEYGGSDAQYLLLRVPVAEGGGRRTSCPTWCSMAASCRPSTLAACSVNVEQVTRAGARGSVDCSGASRAPC